MPLALASDASGHKVWVGSENDKDSVGANPGDEFYTTNTKKRYICVDIGVWTYLHKTG